MKQHMSLPGYAMRRSVMAAVVLGTALTAAATASADTRSAEPSLRAVTDISRYCTACWRNARLHPDAWTDCTQDVFARLLERVHPAHWDRILRLESDERREFLRAIDAVKKRTQRARKSSLLNDEAVADGRDRVDRQRAEERQVVGQAAAEVLSDRQQQILRLSFEGWSVQEIAAELQVGAERVSDEKYKAIRKLREHLHVDEVG